MYRYVSKFSCHNVSQVHNFIMLAQYLNVLILVPIKITQNIIFFNAFIKKIKANSSNFYYTVNIFLNVKNCQICKLQI